MGVTQSLGLFASAKDNTSSGSVTPTPLPTDRAVWGKGMTNTGAWGAAGIAAFGTASLIGGISSLRSAEAEADLLNQEGDQAAFESEMEVFRVAEEGRRFQATQKAKYLMSGVAIQGTPLEVLDDTAIKTQQQIEALSNRGLALRALYQANADQVRSKGRADFLSGLVKTGVDVGLMFATGGQSAVFSGLTSALVK